jgi:adenine-specific DNA-methyltransferase
VPRIKKVIFTPEWNEGMAQRPATEQEARRSPRIVKLLRLESYEDTLSNLALRRTDQQQSLLDSPQAQGPDGLKEQYLLRYQLDVESRGSQSLLNIDAFTDPTAYRLVVKQPGSDESLEVNVDLLETFNYLIGLTVQHIAAPRSFVAEFERSDHVKPGDGQGRLQLKGRLRQSAEGPWWFRTVIGTTPEGRKTLVIWRKLTGDLERDNVVLEEWFKNKQAYSVRDSEFDLIYVNGDSTLENLRLPDETWKLRLIEEDFHRLMFEGTGA